MTALELNASVKNYRCYTTSRSHNVLFTHVLWFSIQSNFNEQYNAQNKFGFYVTTGGLYYTNYSTVTIISARVMQNLLRKYSTVKNQLPTWWTLPSHRDPETVKFYWKYWNCIRITTTAALKQTFVCCDKIIDSNWYSDELNWIFCIWRTRVWKWRA